MAFAASWMDLQMTWANEKQEVWMEHMWWWTDMLKLAVFMEEIIVSNLVILYRFENFHSKNLLLLLSHFSRVQLCVTPQTAAHQAPLSLGFSRQEHWSGLSFPSPMHESEKWKWEVAQSFPTLSDPMDCGLPGSSIHGIFQARVLEWGAIALW